MTIFVEECLTDKRVKELQAFLLSQKPTLNLLWQKEDARQNSVETRRLGLILQSIELCNLDSITAADYAYIASMSEMVDS